MPNLHLQTNWRKLIIKLSQEGRNLGDNFNGLKGALESSNFEIVEKARSIRSHGAEFLLNFSKCVQKPGKNGGDSRNGGHVNGGHQNGGHENGGHKNGGHKNKQKSGQNVEKIRRKHKIRTKQQQEYKSLISKRSISFSLSGTELNNKSRKKRPNNKHIRSKNLRSTYQPTQLLLASRNYPANYDNYDDLDDSTGHGDLQRVPGADSDYSYNYNQYNYMNNNNFKSGKTPPPLIVVQVQRFIEEVGYKQELFLRIPDGICSGNDLIQRVLEDLSLKIKNFQIL